MKTKLLIFKVLAIVLASLTYALSANAYDMVVDGIYYTKLTNNTVEVSYANINSADYSGSITIPSHVTVGIQSWTVRGIGYKAFGECTNLTSVTLPGTLTYVGELAFIRCTSLSSIDIPEGVTWIGSNAFEQCSSMTTAHLPSTLESIGNIVFNNCNSLGYIYCEAYEPPTLGINAFSTSVYSNTYLVLNNKVIMEKYKAAEGWSNFSHISATSYYSFEKDGVYYAQTGPYTVAVCAKDDNYNSYSATVNVPTSVVYDYNGYTVNEVAANAFRNCSNLFHCYLPSTVGKIGDFGFANCNNLCEFPTPENSMLTEIGNNAFSNVYFESITLPESLKKIGNYAFSGCSDLTRIDIPDKVTSVGSYAFWNCTGLKYVTIGSGCETIGDGGFMACSSLLSVTSRAITPPTIGFYTFRISYNEFTTASLYVPYTSVSAYQSASQWSNFTSINQLTYDFEQDGIYYQFTGDNTVGVAPKSSSYNSYSGSVSIPSQVIYGSSTYTVNSICANAFCNSTGLTSVSIPTSVARIEANAFKGCTGLTTITIPSTVTYLGSHAFLDCTGLTRVNISDLAAWCRITFANNGSNPLRYGHNLYVGGSLLTSLTTPGGITKLPNYVFIGCTSITSVALSEGLTTVGYGAFTDCTGITTVTIASSVTSISGQAFKGCTALAAVTSRATTPPGIASSTFDTSHYTSVQLTVPWNSKTTYKAATYWKNFTNIEESAPYDFEVNGIYYRFFGGNQVAVTFRDDTYGCYSGEVVIPETVTYDGWTYIVTCISERAFYRCPYLTKLTIPSTVERIESEAFVDAFMDASNSSITCMAETPPSISQTALDDYYTGDMTLYVVPGSKTAYESANYWNQFGTIVELPYSFVVNGIYYKKLSSNTVSVSYKDSNYNTYSGNVVIPETVTHNGVTYTVTKVDNVAFFNCPDLTSVVIPETVTAIGNTTFKWCTSLTKIVIPNSVTTIGLYAFQGCTALKDVIIGSGVTSIGSYAFNGCTALELGNITCLATTPPTIKSNTFDSDHYHGANLYVPRGCLADYEQAQYWSEFWDVYEFWSLDDALNEEGGTLHFESTGDYPWTVIEGGNGTHYVQSGNAGVHNSTSTMTATVVIPSSGANLWFLFKAWGESNSTGTTHYDKCIFAIDGEALITEGALQNDWRGYSIDLPAGTHTLTWRYTKDGSVNPTGDYFAIDNVILTPNQTVTLGDVNGDGLINPTDATVLINALLNENFSAVNQDNADMDGNGLINITDAIQLINMLLTL